MSFPGGLYILRASPAAGIGGLYATGNSVDAVVTVAPQLPPFIERQWNIRPVFGKEGGYYNISLHSDGSAFGGDWFPEDGKPIPERPVITSEKSYECIQAPNPRVGVDFYAGTNDKEHVVIIPVPVIPDAEAPYWQFKPHLPFVEICGNFPISSSHSSHRSPLFARPTMLW
ncbi:uncharacterized protein LACBIDRAFT_335916 [Laccaria bicolor S238N-H82]|uniref:Clitocypin cysteine proteinase inhibitor n=1 Tax=Laccaria bicolor (strain S238N-H82 / ATCC MYA-4686) TaxID=486041 RepID=B0D715_LACBS|nr:clitocypin cysteine proteinase inhibitor [Laccaria bicolor S238N-H82]XP_001890857.1 uncharacterized protein LACBIDRAFT_335916 [Laccaria bicolor S238N-H82]EDQ98494.1 predicted protein [Laccaria bicolor S238N-H82]EDR09319.1 clitocypin cysteine proteinase inhibitor [Laccaria bicolor S238N-H82]|eukprot:XP_001879668.1 clitocypin cysteine proteinase inhibitor [Laccaria bicolor S238N-H82]